MVKIDRNKEEKLNKYVVFHTDYYTLRWAVGPAEKFINRMRKVIDKRGDWESMIYQEVMRRMNFIKSKDARVDLDGVSYPETVQGFTNAFLDEFKVDTKPSQKTLEEGINHESPKRVVVRPLKKK